MELRDRVANQLRGGPRTARELAGLLGVDKSRINSILYSDRDRFEQTSNPGAPRWTLKGRRASEPNPRASTRKARPATASGPKASAARFDEATLYAWQRDALRDWRAAGRRGIVEAVTGSGKTRVGIAAADEALRRGEKVVVIVPSIELANQWSSLVRSAFPDIRQGRLGGGGTSSLRHCELLIAVMHSASSHDLGLNGESGLLIGDECHRLATETFNLALEDGFQSRLGLSATYRRGDGAHEQYLEPYFGPVCLSLDYSRAIADGVVSPFRVALLAGRFNASEHLEYEDISGEVGKAWAKLVNEFGAPKEPFADFFAYVARLQKYGTAREGIAAGRYMSAFNRRRALLAGTSAKMDLLTSIAPAIADSDRSLLFTNTTDSSETAARILRELGLSVAAFHSKLDARDRPRILERFRSGDLKALIAPRVLDEGVDVPEADLAVVLAASQQRRQMIQRMGRVLRRKADGRQARFVITYIEGTSEDPAEGAYGTFINEILDVAHDVRDFRGDSVDHALRAYLAPGRDVSVSAVTSRPHTGSGRVVAMPSVKRSGTQGRQDLKVERRRRVAATLGISDEQLLGYRRERARVVAGTRGMSTATRQRMIARHLGVSCDFVERWDRAEEDVVDATMSKPKLPSSAKSGPPSHRSPQRSEQPSAKRTAQRPKSPDAARPRASTDPSKVGSEQKKRKVTTATRYSAIRKRRRTPPAQVATCAACEHPIGANGRCGCS